MVLLVSFRYEPHLPRAHLLPFNDFCFLMNPFGLCRSAIKPLSLLVALKFLVRACFPLSVSVLSLRSNAAPV